MQATASEYGVHPCDLLIACVQEVIWLETDGRAQHPVYEAIPLWLMCFFAKFSKKSVATARISTLLEYRHVTAFASGGSHTLS